MPPLSASQIIERFVTHPEGTVGLMRRVGYVPLLPLLELPYMDVVQSFSDMALSNADLKNISLSGLVVFALRLESDYWAGLAVRWLATGFPMDEAIVSAGVEMIQTKRATQSDRHTLMRLIKRFESRT